MFNLKAANHEVVLTSEGFEQRAEALAGIEAVRTNGVDAANFELRTPSGAEPYFVLKAASQQVIGKSEKYSSEAAARSGIESVIKNCRSTEIKDAV